MVDGIYCYIDNKTDKVVYVGKDSYIHCNMRHYRHVAPSSYDAQPINRILQNNRSRYRYKILKKGNFGNNLLNALEILYIRRYRPKFNFTIGGDKPKGCIPWNKGKTNVYSEETLKRLSESHKGQVAWNKGKHISEETKEKLRQVNLGKKLSEEAKQKISESGRERAKSIEYRLKRCKRSKTGVLHLNLEKHKQTKTGFVWTYKWRKNAKAYKISRVSLTKLKQEVLNRGLEWIVVDENKYANCIKEAKINGRI